VSGTRSFGNHVSVGVRVDRDLKLHPAGDINSGRSEAVELGRIVGQQNNPRTVQHSEHTSGDAIVTFIVVESERGVGVDRIETLVLQLVRPHLVGETEPASFLRHIEDDTATEVFELRQSQPKLISAIAAP